VATEVNKDAEKKKEEAEGKMKEEVVAPPDDFIYEEIDN